MDLIEKDFVYLLYYEDRPFEFYIFEDNEIAREILWDDFVKDLNEGKDKLNMYLEMVNNEIIYDFDIKDIKQLKELFERTGTIHGFGYIIEEPVMGVEE